MVFEPSDFAPHPCQEHLAKAGDTLGYQDLVGEVEMLQWVEASGWTPRMVLTIVQCTDSLHCKDSSSPKG